MAYNQQIADRLEKILKAEKEFTQKKMFGGVGFLLNGNMCVGVYKDSLILRLSEESAEKALKIKDFKVMDITGRPMKGWIMADNLDAIPDSKLSQWIQESIEFVTTFPAKGKQ